MILKNPFAYHELIKTYISNFAMKSLAEAIHKVLYQHVISLETSDVLSSNSLAPRIMCDVLSAYPDAVSYTHLDVYKRQTYDC